MKIIEALKNGIKKLNNNNIEEPTLKAKLLLSHIIKQPKKNIMFHYEDELNFKQLEEFILGIDKLANNVPLQYIINKQEFFKQEFFVNENVLIPQPDTEILVEEVIEIASKFENAKILDLCTGSGAIAISLANNLENVEVTGTDISKEALEVSKINDKKNLVKFIQSDLFENLQKEKFNIIVSNPPYIKTDVIKTLSMEVQNEPSIALDGGEDGLKFYKEIINNANNYLYENGYLCLEIGDDQREEVIQLLKDKNYKNIYSKKDLGGNDRIVIANI